jgi:hypothetical protein
MNTTPTAAATKGNADASRRFQTLPGDHRFFSVMAIVTVATIVAGFSNTYVPKVVNGAPALPSIIHLHAAIFASWLAVFVAQTTLVLSGRTPVHRRLGVAAVALAALMLVVGVATSHYGGAPGTSRHPGSGVPRPEGCLLLNLGATVVFATLVGAGCVSAGTRKPTSA